MPMEGGASFRILVFFVIAFGGVVLPVRWLTWVRGNAFFDFDFANAVK
jgi:hypothetical protein